MTECVPMMITEQKSDSCHPEGSAATRDLFFGKRETYFFIENLTKKTLFYNKISSMFALSAKG